MSLPDKDPGDTIRITVDGKSVSTKDLPKEQSEMLFRNMNSGEPVYRKSDGGYTSDRREADITTSVSLNQETGTVDVSAPQSFLDSDYYKNNLQPTFEAISQRYRENPDVTQDLQFTDSNGKEVTKSMEDYINELSEGTEDNNHEDSFQKLVESVVELKYDIDDKNEEYGFTEEDIAAGKGFNEENMMRMRQQVYNYGDIEHKDTDLQALPVADHWKDFLKAAFDEAGVGDEYDEETGTITRKGWREFFNRNNQSDDKLNAFINLVEDELSTAIENKDADRIANAQSILGTIDAENPDSFWLRNAAEDVGIFFLNFLTNSTALGQSQAFYEDAASVASAIETNLETGEKGWWTKNFERQVEGQAQVRSDIQDIVDRAKRLNSSVASASALGTGTGEIAGFALLLGEAVALGKGVTNIVKGVVPSRTIAGAIEQVKTAEKVTKGAAAVMTAAEADAAAAGLYTAANIGLRSMATNLMVHTVDTAVGIVAKTAATAGAGVALEISADAILDATLMDPVLTKRFLAGTDDEEARAYVLTTLAQDVGISTGVRGGAKTWQYATTKVPVVGMLNTALTKLSMKIRTGAANIGEAVASKVPGTDLDKKAQKYRARLEAANNGFLKIHWNNKLAAVEGEQETRTLNKNLRAKAAQVASTKGVEEFNDALVEYRNLQNLTDAIKDSVRWNISRLRSTPGVGSSLADVDDSISKLNKALKNEGQQFKSSKALLKGGEAGRSSSLFGLDEKTSDYISAMIDKEHIEAYRRKYGELDRAKTEQLAADEEYISYFEEVASAELKAAADEAIPRIYRFWNDYMDYATSPEFAIYNRAEVLEDRASGLWGNEINPTYAMLQRTKDEYIPYSMRIDSGKTTKPEMGGLQERVYGSAEHYKDPFVTIYNVMIGDSREIVLKEYMDAISTIPGIFKRDSRLITAEQSEFARKTKKTADAARAKVAKATSTVTKESSDIAANAAQRYAKTFTSVKVDAKATAKEAKKAERQLGKLRDKTAGAIERSKVTPAQVSGAVSGMSIEQKQQIAQANGIPTGAFRDVDNGSLRDMIKAPNRYRTDEVEKMITDSTGYINVDEFMTTSYQLQPKGYRLQSTTGEAQGTAELDEYSALYSEWINTFPEATQKQIAKEIKAELMSGASEAEKKALNSRLRKNGITTADAMQAFEKSALNTGGVGANTLRHKVDATILKDGGAEYLRLNAEATEKLATTKEAKLQARYDAHNARVAEAEGVAADANKAYDEALDAADLETSQEDTYDSIDETIDAIVSHVDADPTARKAFGATGDIDAERQDYILTELGRKENVDEFTTTIYNSQYDSIRSVLEAKYGKTKTKDEIDTLADRAAKAYADIAKKRLKSRAATARNNLQRNGSWFSDSDEMFDEAERLNRDISGLSSDITSAKDNTVVRFLDSEGREEFYEVSPAIATLINTTPTTHIDTKFEAFKRATVSLFRIGTTGFLNLASYTNQFARDFTDALVNAGSYRTAKTMNKVISNAFGEPTATAFRDWTPQEMAKYGSSEVEQQQNIFEAQKKIGYGRSTASTEYTAYQFARNRRIASLESGEFKGIDAGVDARPWWEKTADTLNDISDRMNALHNVREKGLRQRTYSNSYAKAIKEGYTAKQADIIATFNMQNATTNFARSMVHCNNLRKSVPYLGAAVNGAKSFYRMFELDPIGVGTRIFAGVITPTMALVGQSLQSEENRKVYDQIPEWQKESAITFVVEGQVYTIPLPEQVASLMTPWRQFVEHCCDADKGTFNEMMMSDIIGLSPIDFSGFTSLDIARLYADDSEMWTERAKLGLTRVVSQVVDPVTKSAIMAATGYDPYTNTKIDKSFVTIDEDGQAIIVDKSAGKTMTMLRDLAATATNGDWQISASMAQSLLQNVFGKGGIALLDGVLTLGGGVVDGINTGDVSKAGEALLEVGVGTPLKQVSDPLNYEAYDRSLSAWREAVRYLFEKKNAISESREVQSVLDALETETDPQKIKKLKAQRDNFVDDYQQEVLKVVNNLKSRFPESTFNTSKFYTVVSLLNMNGNSKQQNWYAETALSKSVTSEEKQQGKMEALNTMVRMGFPDIEGPEVLGYVKEEFGERKVVYANPLSILAYEATKSQQKDIISAEVTRLRNDNNWYDLRQAMYSQLDVIRQGKQKLTSEDYNEMSAIQSDYNRQIMKDLAPIIANTSPEQVFNSDDALSVLREYIVVPYSARGTVNNKYAEVPGNVSDAYIENYLKAILKVNDTKYAYGTGDWSGRGQWWKEDK